VWGPVYADKHARRGKVCKRMILGDRVQVSVSAQLRIRVCLFCLALPFLLTPNNQTCSRQVSDSFTPLRTRLTALCKLASQCYGSSEIMSRQVMFMFETREVDTASCTSGHADKRIVLHVCNMTLRTSSSYACADVTPFGGGYGDLFAHLCLGGYVGADWSCV